MRADFDFPLDHAPWVELDKEGLFHVVDRRGAVTIDRVMEPRILFLYLGRGRRGIGEWQVRFGPLTIAPADHDPPPPEGPAHIRMNIFIDDPPEVRVGTLGDDDDRAIHVIDRSGGIVMDRAMSAAHFAIYLDRGEALLAPWHAANAGRGSKGE